MYHFANEADEVDFISPFHLNRLSGMLLIGHDLGDDVNVVGHGGDLEGVILEKIFLQILCPPF